MITHLCLINIIYLLVCVDLGRDRGHDRVSDHDRVNNHDQTNTYQKKLKFPNIWTA